MRTAAASEVSTARRPAIEWCRFCVWLPTAQSAAPISRATSAPIRAHDAIPLASCWSAALPGSALVEG